jgi:hypothetical protein
MTCRRSAAAFALIFVIRTSVRTENPALAVGRLPVNLNLGAILSGGRLGRAATEAEPNAG